MRPYTCAPLLNLRKCGGEVPRRADALRVESLPELAGENLDRRAGPAGHLLLPGALRLEPPVADGFRPGAQRRVELARGPHVTRPAPDHRDDVGDDADECAERSGALDRVLAAPERRGKGAGRPPPV